MNKNLLKQLSVISPEEAAILEGRDVVDRSLYMDGSHDVVTGDKLLPPGRQITLRPHTRFIDFPEHTHDYVEMVYMCRGTTAHRVNGQAIALQEGELLLLGQNARQSIAPAGMEDIAVNIIVRPSFFGGTLPLWGEEETPLRRFILSCLSGESESGWLLFHVGDVFCIQNLMENLVDSLLRESANRQTVLRLTMSLLFAQLQHTQRAELSSPSQTLLLTALRYIETHYTDGSLSNLAAETHYELSTLSRLLRKKTGKSYTELVQEKRLSQAAWLLKNTDKHVDEIAALVGYENKSYSTDFSPPDSAARPGSIAFAIKDTFFTNSDLENRPPFRYHREEQGAILMKYYLAIDIGASSGRHIVGWMENGELKTEEIYRFPNGVEERDRHLVWDVEALLARVKIGIDRALEAHPQIESLSIDTWGCDYVLLEGDRELWPCYAYRDYRTEGIREEVHARISFPELYRRTGCQFQLFNTIYQLSADRAAGRLDKATDFLMIPEYLMYKLTGVKAKEYTNATTTGLVRAETGEFDREIIARLGLPEGLFPRLRQPGTEIGSYKGIRVVLCATHDTASAVEGIPTGVHSVVADDHIGHTAKRQEQNAPYISSGTWSLLGVKTPKPITDEASEDANYSNEGGVGYNRYQKNIMGMWLVNRLRDELCPGKPWSEIVGEAEQSSFDRTVDVNADCFLSPVSMQEAFDRAMGSRLAEPGDSDLVITNMTPEQIDAMNAARLPLSVGDYFRCACRSLALSYKNALAELERNTGKTYDRLYIVGGGAKNRFLNNLTAEFTGKEVIVLPIEATAIGNLKIQINCSSAQRATVGGITC